MESPKYYSVIQAQTVPDTNPEAFRLSRRSVVVGGVMSGEDGKLRGSIAASTLDGHLSNTQSSHSHRHGFHRVFAINVRFGFEAGIAGITSISRSCSFCNSRRNSIDIEKTL